MMSYVTLDASSGEVEATVTTDNEEIIELKAKIEKLESALKSNADAYSRGWVDALAEAHQWSNPTTALKERDDG